MKRKIVKEINLLDYEILFNGTIDDIISRLQTKLEEGWEGVESHGEYDSHEYYLYKHRPENDEEYALRMKKIEKEKLKNKQEKEARRKMYEILKKEFSES